MVKKEKTLASRFASSADCGSVDHRSCLFQKLPGGLDPLIINLIEIPFKTRVLTCALGIDTPGRKRFLGFQLAEAKSKQAAMTLAEGLLTCGVTAEQKKLFLIPDSDDLRLAIELVLGDHHEVQRCRRDKEKRVLAVIGAKTKAETRRLIQAAWIQGGYEGLDQLERLAGRLEAEHSRSSRRLRQGIDECFTVDCLGIHPSLAHSLAKTIQLTRLARSLRRSGTPWIPEIEQAANILRRFLCEEEQRFRALSVYKELPTLQRILRNPLPSGDGFRGPPVSLVEGQIREEARPVLPDSDLSQKLLAPHRALPGRLSQSSHGKDENFQGLGLSSNPWLVRAVANKLPFARNILFRGNSGKSMLPQLSRLIKSPAVLHRPFRHTNLDAVWKTDLTREEEFRLVQRLFLLSDRNFPRTVVFSGVQNGNGCSRVCARAGVTLATHVAGSVCVVDANLQSPSLHHYFGVKNTRGLLEAVIQADAVHECARRVYAGNLWVMPTGSAPLDPHISVTEERINSFVAELRTAFDYVLIDVPPFRAYDYSVLLGRLADGAVLVIEANHTYPESAGDMKRTLEASNVNVLGAVLNKRTFPIPHWFYQKFFALYNRRR